MRTKQIVLARKYATAYLNEFIHEMNLDDYDHIAQLLHFLKKNRSVTTHFMLPGLREVKHKAADLLIASFALPAHIKKLFMLLEEKKRLWLLPAVFEYILQGYRQRHNIMVFSIESSLPLKEQHIAIIKQFLEKITHHTILYTYKRNEKLIAGIKLQSDTLQWEHSIARQLQEIGQSLRI